MNLEDKVLDLHLTLINDPDGVCCPASVSEKLNEIVLELGFKIQFNDLIEKFEVVKND